MTARASSPAVLTLHAVRLLGFADGGRAATRFGLERAEVGELLMDFEAYGWVSRVEFAGRGGWTLSETGRAENERQLAAELAGCGGSDEVARIHAAFVPLNARFLETATRWQVRPVPGDSMALNDHTDFRWDDQVVDVLGSVGRRLGSLCPDLSRLGSLCPDLSGVLTRFDGYAERYTAALSRVRGGERRWVDAVGIESCHVVWMQLHEDLLATLGIERGHEG